MECYMKLCSIVYIDVFNKMLHSVRNVQRIILLKNKNVRPMFGSIYTIFV